MFKCIQQCLPRTTIVIQSLHQNWPDMLVTGPQQNWCLARTWWGLNDFPTITSPLRQCVSARDEWRVHEVSKALIQHWKILKSSWWGMVHDFVKYLSSKPLVESPADRMQKVTDLVNVLPHPILQPYHYHAFYNFRNKQFQSSVDGVQFQDARTGADEYW
jgi:hypothetical protein